MDALDDLFDYAGSKRFSEREKAALHYADLFKQGEHSIDKDLYRSRPALQR